VNKELPAEVVGLTARLEFMKRARRELADRRRRIGLFGSTMFGEAGWEILLALYGRHGARLTIAQINGIVATAPTTTFRWLRYLELHQLIRREPHPVDTRAVLIELTDKAVRFLDVYFSETIRAEQ
jgi:DNA-binding MarR family transcriptional regulator